MNNEIKTPDIRLSDTRFIITREGIEIPKDTTFDEWKCGHKALMLIKDKATEWLRDSRNYAIENYGMEDVARAEAQMEFEFGFSRTEPRIDLNPDDKSRALVTIEGISQSFSLWKRKMASEIPYWTRDQKERALDLLEPLAQQYKEIKQSLD